MELNERNSCTSNSRPVNITYFLIKDCVDQSLVEIKDCVDQSLVEIEDCVDQSLVEIKYCPITLMLADLFTKPLQGKAFMIFRSVIMGCKHINELLLDLNFLMKVRVRHMNVVIK